MTPSRLAPFIAQSRAPLLRRWLHRLFSPFWVVPTAWCVLAVAAGFALPQLDEARTGWLPLIFEGGSEGARTLLSTIAGAMISVTGLVFSITIVVLQLASSQFSPRVLRTFLDSRTTQHTLGVFAASFLYALTVLRSIVDGVGVDEVIVPQLAVTTAFIFVLAAVGMFLAFIHNITLSISVSTIIHTTAEATRKVLGERWGSADADVAPEHDLTQMDHQILVGAQNSGYLDVLDVDTLVELGAAYDVRIEMLHPLGSFVPEGGPLALVEGPAELADSDHDWTANVHRGLELRRERTMEQDLTYGVRRLVDIAEKALSPGINDPTTAVLVLDEMHDILRRMAPHPNLASVHEDDDGVPRVVTVDWTFGQFLDLAIDEIAHWGADSIQVPARLQVLFDDILTVASADNFAVITDKAAHVRRTATQA